MRTLKFASLFACCALAVHAFAQDPGTQPPTNQPPGVGGATQPGQPPGEGRVGRRGGRMQGGMPGSMMVQDRDFAMMLTFGNHGEVEMANFVKDKLQNDQAKQFANHMIQDHTQFLQQLAQFSKGGMPGAGEAGVGNVGTRDGAGRDIRTPGTATFKGNLEGGQSGGGVNVAVGGGQGVNVGVGNGDRSFYTPGMSPMLAVKHEICQECLNLEKKDLEQKQGAEVDKCYIGSQIVKHTDMLAQLTVMQRHAQDSQFKEMLGQGIQKTQQHLDMAKNIMKQLEGQK